MAFTRLFLDGGNKTNQAKLIASSVRATSYSSSPKVIDSFDKVMIISTNTVSFRITMIGGSESYRNKKIEFRGGSILKSTFKYSIEETLVQVIHDDGEVVVKRGIWVEGEGLCAIYDLDEGHFKFVCTTRFELNIMLATQDLRMKDPKEDERLCSECGVPMQEGYYFESDGTQYCGEECLTKVIT